VKDSLQPGLETTRRITVDTDRTIGFMGEALRVYATPSMVLDIERTCKDLLQEHLDEGENSVGARVEIDHLGATLLGMWVDVHASIVELDRRRVLFDVAVTDQLGDKVGACRHTRFVVDLAKQKERLDAKRARLAEAG
jgi:fluoroacetyl-CoA thioesterase